MQKISKQPLEVRSKILILYNILWIFAQLVNIKLHSCSECAVSESTKQIHLLILFGKNCRTYFISVSPSIGRIHLQMPRLGIKRSSRTISHILFNTDHNTPELPAVKVRLQRKAFAVSWRCRQTGLHGPRLASRFMTTCNISIENSRIRSRFSNR